MSIPNLATIGFVGAGNIGSNVARAALAHGYSVVLGNSRGPDTLQQLVDELGPDARAGTAAEAARDGDLVVLSVPLKDIDALPTAELDGKIVLDACNYYPERDGQVPELDAERTTTSQLVQQQLPGSQVVKAFNHIVAADIPTHGSPAGTPDRRARVVAGDDSAAKEVVKSFVDDLGFDVVDVGDLSESWRIQRDTPGYTVRLDRDHLVTALAAATREPVSRSGR